MRFNPLEKLKNLSDEQKQALKRGGFVAGVSTLGYLPTLYAKKTLKPEKNLERVEKLKEYANSKKINIESDKSGEFNPVTGDVHYDENKHPASILAHELGHATLDRNHNQLSLMPSYMLGRASGPLHTQYATDFNPNHSLGLLGVTTLGSIPMLREEMKANKKGLEILDELDIKTEQDKKDMKKGLASYFGAVAAPALATGSVLLHNKIKQASVLAECLEKVGKEGG